MHKQNGFTFWSFTFTVGTIVILALLAMLLFPAYAEYFTIKKAINRIGNDPSFSSMTDGDIREMMNKTLEIDHIHSIKSSDLVIQRSSSGGTTVSVDYEVVVPIVANVSALIEFSASTKNKMAAAGE